MAKCYTPPTNIEIAIPSALQKIIESSDFRSSSAIRKKPLKFNHARTIYKDLGDLRASTLKIGTLHFDCSKDPDVTQAADLLMEMSSSASSSSEPPVWSDEMYPWYPCPEVGPPPLRRQKAFYIPLS